MVRFIPFLFLVRISGLGGGRHAYKGLCVWFSPGQKVLIGGYLLIRNCLTGFPQVFKGVNWGEGEFCEDVAINVFTLVVHFLSGSSVLSLFLVIVLGRDLLTDCCGPVSLEPRGVHDSNEGK